MASEKQSAAEMQAELARLQLEEAQLRLEETRERIAAAKSDKQQKARRNAQRQTELRTDRTNQRMRESVCSHRQGGSPDKPHKGKGPTALRVQNMPDGFTKRIACPLCRLTVFSPHPGNQSRKLKPGETAADRDARVKKYQADVAAFDELYEKSRDGLSGDDVQEMHCGVTIEVINRDGEVVYPKRPCDSYAQYQDDPAA